nr:hypothetical protein BaRGS_004289 [Batillaria attramentaria]
MSGDNRDDDNNDDRSARYDGSCDYPGTFENVITAGNNDNRTTRQAQRSLLMSVLQKRRWRNELDTSDKGRKRPACGISCNNPSCINPSCVNPSCVNPCCINPSCNNPSCNNPSCVNPSCVNPCCINPSCNDPSCFNPCCINPSCNNPSCIIPSCVNPCCNDPSCDNAHPGINSHVCCSVNSCIPHITRIIIDAYSSDNNDHSKHKHTRNK